MKNEDKEKTIEDLIHDQYTLYALINVLGRKGLITKEEILDELDRLEKDIIARIETKN